MAPVEFEKELKKRLRSRQARPSEDAWDQIAAQLDADGPAPGKRSRWWVGLAAASIALLVSLLFFWDRPAPLPVTDPTVETPEGSGLVPVDKQEMPPIDSAAANNQGGIEGTAEAQRSENSEVAGVSTAAAFNPGSMEDKAATHRQTPPPEGAVDTELPVHGLPDTAPASMVAEQNKVGSVNDARIDSLLQEAQNAIAARDTTQAAASVDALELLALAEEELDQTFREQMIQKLREGYNRMRQSVAARKQ